MRKLSRYVSLNSAANNNLSSDFDIVGGSIQYHWDCGSKNCENTNSSVVLLLNNSAIGGDSDTIICTAYIGGNLKLVIEFD